VIVLQKQNGATDQLFCGKIEQANTAKSSVQATPACFDMSIDTQERKHIKITLVQKSVGSLIIIGQGTQAISKAGP